MSLRILKKSYSLVWRPLATVFSIIIERHSVRVMFGVQTRYDYCYYILIIRTYNNQSVEFFSAVKTVVSSRKRSFATPSAAT